MFKKTVGTLVIAAALVGFAGSGSAASSVSQDQELGGYNWENTYKHSYKKDFSFGGFSFASGFQAQGGKTTGSGTATQEQSVSAGGSSGEVSQEVSTDGPANVHQVQRSTLINFNFNKSIEGGVSLQNNMTHAHSFQYQRATSK